MAIVQGIVGLAILALAAGGFVLVIAFVVSFINRIGNPYDKW